MIFLQIWLTTLKVFSVANKMKKKKKILVSRNTYELFNNKTMGVQINFIKNPTKKWKKKMREREREMTFLCGKIKYAKNEREWQIYIVREWE